MNGSDIPLVRAVLFDCKRRCGIELINKIGFDL